MSVAPAPTPVSLSSDRLAVMYTLAGRLRALSWPSLRAQLGRQLLALMAIALGVALGWGVQLLNGSAMAEMGAAARAVAGTPDLVLRAGETQALGLPQLEALAARPEIAQWSAVIEAQAVLVSSEGAKAGRSGLRLLGLDPLKAISFSPALLPRPFATGAAHASGPGDLWTLLAPDAVYLNAAALKLLQTEGQPRPERIQLRLLRDGRARTFSLRLSGLVAAGGAPLAVLDIAAAQSITGRLDAVDHVDLRLRPGQAGDDPALRAALSTGALAGLRVETPQDAAGQMAALSRAYRVNLGVLSLMALFTGSFLVFAVSSLSVAQRLPQFALLGVLGMSASERAALILAEAALLGLLGTVLGLALGTGLAALGLHLLSGDLGSGLLGGATPALRIEPWPLALYGLLGLAVSLGSAVLPALQLRRMAAAEVLKGLAQAWQPRLPPWLAPALLVLGLLLALLPPVWELPLAAYAGMLCLLLGGLAAVPALVRLLARPLASRQSAGALLLRQRATEQSGEAAQMLAGVLVALALSVAMLVMVASFRGSLNDWLRQMLPADLYVRSSLRAADGQGAPLSPQWLRAVQAEPWVQDLAPQRSRRAWVGDEAVTLLARRIDPQRLPLLGEPAPSQPGETLLPVYISEALRDSRRLAPGDRLTLNLARDGNGDGVGAAAYVAGVWRDYSRQTGALMIDREAYRRWSGDDRVTELALWLAPGQDLAQAQSRLRELASQSAGPGADAGADLEIAASGELLAMSLRLFDRSFAVTYWLQAVALALGLVGVAASLSSQVLARRREFGLLLHLGFTRAQLRRLLLAETLLYSAAGALAGLLLGLAISAVLVHVVNPQSFHWSMEMAPPWTRLAALLAAMMLAALGTAALAGRRLAQADALQAVKEDW